MLRLKNVLSGNGLSTGNAAKSAGISRSAVSQIVNNNVWPKTTPRGAIEDALANFLQTHGVVATGCFEVEPDRSSDPVPDEATTKGVVMLLRKQSLSQSAKTHFKLSRDPFAQEITEPDDVFLTPQFRERLADMESAVLNGRFIAVAAESGSGKSTLRELLEERLKNQDVKIIKPYILGMEDNDKAGKTLRVAHIEEAIIRALDPTEHIKRSSEARGHQVHELLKARGGKCAVVIEEAHALPIPTLKHFKRLRELKDGLKPLLGILLIGQQELEDKLGLNKKEVREVMQRCELVRLEPLGQHLEDYITHRFSRAGIVQAGQVFDASAIAAIREELKDTASQMVRQGEKSYIQKTEISLLYPLAVGNLAVAAMNLAAELGMPKVTGDAVRRAMK